MGKRGRQPKPLKIRVLEGNPSRKPLNFDEPTCDLPAVKPSAVMADELASLEWDRVMAAMPPGLYTALDVAGLTMHVTAWSLLVKAQSDIDLNGLLLINESGISKPNPAVRVWKLASEMLLQTADRLGLHPGARTRLGIPKRGAEPAPSRFAGLLGAKKLS